MVCVWVVFLRGALLDGALMPIDQRSAFLLALHSHPPLFPCPVPSPPPFQLTWRTPRSRRRPASSTRPRTCPMCVTVVNVTVECGCECECDRWWWQATQAEGRILMSLSRLVLSNDTLLRIALHPPPLVQTRRRMLTQPSFFCHPTHPSALHAGLPHLLPGADRLL